jgi:hypothetical protein
VFGQVHIDAVLHVDALEVAIPLVGDDLQLEVNLVLEVPIECVPKQFLGYG